MSGDKYDWKQRGQIQFTEDDIAMAMAGLNFDNSHKTIAHLDTDKGVNGMAVQLFGRLGTVLEGRVKQAYNGLDIVVPKDQNELRDAALYALRYNSEYTDLRRDRAEESGIFPADSED